MPVKPLDTLEIETAETVEFSIIWLHGLGASGHDFEPIVPELDLLQRPGVRFIFPHAPIRPITVNGGAAMRGWYDISSLDFESRHEDRDGIRESTESVFRLVEHENARGIESRNVFLAGFSQGGAVALHAGLTSTEPLGGVLALSTYLPLQAESIEGWQANRHALPIFMAHGQQDDVIRPRYGERSYQVMGEAGLEVEWHTYLMPHSISTEEVADISSWLRRHLGM